MQDIRIEWGVNGDAINVKSDYSCSQLSNPNDLHRHDYELHFSLLVVRTGLMVLTLRL